MTESRLFKILYLLLEQGRTTAPELASLFEVSIRTIYRDVDKLSLAGIPISVSYTHLDVYKRQILLIMSLKLQRCLSN